MIEILLKDSELRWQLLLLVMLILNMVTMILDFGGFADWFFINLMAVCWMLFGIIEKNKFLSCFYPFLIVCYIFNIINYRCP